MRRSYRSPCHRKWLKHEESINGFSGRSQGIANRRQLGVQPAARFVTMAVFARISGARIRWAESRGRHAGSARPRSACERILQSRSDAAGMLHGRSIAESAKHGDFARCGDGMVIAKHNPAFHSIRIKSMNRICEIPGDTQPGAARIVAVAPLLSAIDLKEQASLRYWCRMLGVTPLEMCRAVESVGSNPSAVRDYMKRRRSAPIRLHARRVRRAPLPATRAASAAITILGMRGRAKKLLPHGFVP